MGDTDPERDAQAIANALAEIRRLRVAPPFEWDALHSEAIRKARYAGASPEQIDEACKFPGD